MPISGSKCFGRAGVDIGHSRVPDPPAKMTGRMSPPTFMMFMLLPWRKAGSRAKVPPYSTPRSPIICKVLRHVGHVGFFDSDALMEAMVAFWSHALAAALFSALVLWELRRGIRIGSGQRMLLAALALTACWAWLTALQPYSTLAAYAETARNLVWVGVLYRLAEGDSADLRQRGVMPVYAAVAGALGLQMLFDTLPLLIGAAEAGAAFRSTAIILRTDRGGGGAGAGPQSLRPGRAG